MANISRIDIFKLKIPKKYPTKVAIGSVKSILNVIVKIYTDIGHHGWGEASPCSYITGDTQQTNYETAQQLAQLIIGKNALAIEPRMNEINAFIKGEFSIRSAFDMALYDIAAKAAKMPLFQFLGGEICQTEGQAYLRTDITIGLQDTVEDTIERAKQILESGFVAIKLKVGRPGLGDIPHVAAVRELVGPDISIKIDSNQGWDLPTAIAAINAMDALNLEYSEQPLKHWDHHSLAKLRQKVNLPICADESVFDHHDALDLIRTGATDYLNIKLGKSGGIQTALKINAIAEAAGNKCMIGCFGESRLALTAAAHLAIARPNICFLDLDSAFSFECDPVIGGMTYDPKLGGVIHVTDEPGHGASFDEAALTDKVTIE